MDRACIWVLFTKCVKRKIETEDKWKNIVYPPVELVCYPLSVYLLNKRNEKVVCEIGEMETDFVTHFDRVGFCMKNYIWIWYRFVWEWIETILLFMLGIGSLTILEWIMRVFSINKGDSNNIEIELSSFTVFCEKRRIDDCYKCILNE